MGSDSSGTEGLSAEQRREMLRKILKRKVAQARTFPLSLGQEALWFLDRLDPGRPTYGFYPAVRLRGPLDLVAVERALDEIVRRHDALRTVFPEVDGVPVQRTTPAGTYKLPVLDLSELPSQEREAAYKHIVEERPPIDLVSGPVAWAQVVRVAENDHIVMLRIHHIVFDGWSLGVLAREMYALYSAFRAGRPSPLPPLEIQYADFAAWQRKYLQGETLEKFRRYWQKQLEGLPPLDLATDYPRPAIRTSRGATLPMNLSPELSQAVLEFSRQQRVTPFMTLLAGFQEVLRRFSGQEDFAIGTPTANRRQKSFEPLIGYFINVLVLRADLSGNPSFRELVHRVRQTSLEAYEHQELTLDKIVEAVKPPRDLSRHPLFQVMFVVQNNPRPRVQVPDFEVIPLGEMEPGRTAKFELTAPLRVTKNGIEGKLNFNTDLFAPQTIERMIGHFRMVLADGLADPDRPLSKLRLLNDAERQTVLVDWNATDLDYLETTGVVELFESHAERTPEAEAVVDATHRWTYRQLNERANQLARYLQRQGVGPEVAVGICLERSPELLMAILAVMKAGGAYVPLDLAYSRDAGQRLDFILQDAEVSLVVTNSSAADALGADEANRNLKRQPAARDAATPSLALRASAGAGQPPQPGLIVLDREADAIASENRDNVHGGATAENLAYIIFTSGSTGRPKGVMVTHGNLLNAYRGWEQSYGLGTELTTHLQMASFGFDVFSGDWVRALGSGGKLVICRKEIMLSAPDLFDLLRREEVDVAEFVPVVLRNLLEYIETSQQSLSFMRLVIVGSDAWYVEDHKRTQQLLGPQTRLVNSYGLTETTIDSSFFGGDVGELPNTGMVPIGYPFANVRLYILDDHQRPVPVGVTGELYIGGRGVARGYVNPELDEERFLKDPFAASPDARMCRTGDRVRWRTDGQVDFLGRADDQVKIRGFRIEPGEVEEVLREHPLLCEAAVLAHERSVGDLQLVAYVSAPSGNEVKVAEMRRYLRGKLPDYMIPSLFVSLDVMPTTPSGKVDRQALPEPDWRGAAAEDYVAPRTDVERQLAEIWSEVLQVERVGVNDDFFELGGNSLMALRLNSQVRTAFSIDLPLVALFVAPTLAELAERIAAIQLAGGAADASPFFSATDDGLDPFSTQADVDWDAETSLDPAIRVTPDLRPPQFEPARILLTGATGFLGAFLLRELRDATDAEIYCLVRSSSPEEAAKRLDRNLRNYDLDDVASSPRIVPVCGDFSEPQFGLSADEYMDLAGSIDTIYHNGANTNYMAPYQMLRTANVAGVMEILKLATQTRVKPVHFVSTMSVVNAARRLSGGTIDEDEPLGPVTNLRRGYAQSKWVAETLIREAVSRGLPVTIHRPGRIISDSVSGAASATDHVAILLKTCVEMGAAPDPEEFRSEFTPVDYVARAIVALSRSSDLIGHTFHECNPKLVPIADAYRAIRGQGYTLRVVPREQWQEQLIDHARSSDNPVLWGLAQIVSVLGATASQRRPGADGRRPRPVDGAKTIEALRRLGVELPTVNAEFLARFIGFLSRRRVLPPPADRTPTDSEPAADTSLAADEQVAPVPAASTAQAEPPQHEQPCPVSPSKSAGAGNGEPTADRDEGNRAKPAAKYVAPRNDLEQRLVELCEELLPVERVGIHDNFLVLGGDELFVTRLLTRIEELGKVRLPVREVFEAPTVAELGARVAEPRKPPVKPSRRRHQSLVQLATGGAAPPLFCVHGMGGHVPVFLPLARRLGTERPVYALQGLGIDPGPPPHDRIEAMASYYLDEIRSEQPHGPYLLAGWSMGGLIALEMTRRLAALGEQVLLVAMLDTYLTVSNRTLDEIGDGAVMETVASRLNIPMRDIQRLPPDRRWDYVADKARDGHGIGVAAIRRLAETCQAHLTACKKHKARPYHGPAVLLRASEPRRRRDEPWAPVCPQLQVEQVPGDHFTMLQDAHVQVLAERLGHYLRSSDETTDNIT